MPRRPQPFTTFYPDNIPAQLQELDHWLLWQPEPTDDGRLAKVPINPHAPRWARRENSDDARRACRLGSSTNPKRWTEFDHAAKIAERDGQGLGFALDGSGLVAIDLDHVVRDDGTLEPWAEKVVATLDSYTEVSPSGDGLHVFVRGTIPRVLKLTDPGLEMYVAGRYLTVTGERWPGTPATVEDRAEEILAVHSQYAPAEPAKSADVSAPPRAAVTLEDEEVLRRAFAAKNGEKFKALYEGDGSGYPSGSEPDAALACLLAFWCGNDEAQIERIMLTSGLVRDKWFKRRRDGTLLQYEVQRAVAQNTQVYTPRQSRPLTWGQRLTRELAREAAQEAATGDGR